MPARAVLRTLVNKLTHMPFAPLALPRIIARMGGSDFHAALPTSSLVRLVRRCRRVPRLPRRGSPSLPRTPNLWLEMPSDLGVFAGARLKRPCDFCLRPTVRARPVPTTFFSRLNSFKVGILRYLYSSPGFTAYASTAPLPRRLQGWILRPWLAATQAGFPPAGLRDIARPQHCPNP